MMNIFVLDTDPVVAASYHNDRHVTKQVLETAQMLSTAHVYLDGLRTAKARIGDIILRPTHVNHPCAKWVRESSENYDWMVELGCALLNEYERRFRKTHAFVDLITRLATKPLNLPAGERTPWPQCMPARFHRGTGYETEAYRNYYFFEKQHLAHWTGGAPTWWLRMSDEAEYESKAV